MKELNISPHNWGTFESMMIFLFLMVGDVRFFEGYPMKGFQ